MHRIEVLLSLIIIGIVAGCAGINPPAIDNAIPHASAPECIITGEPGEGEGLIDGAFAEWLDDGTGEVSAVIVHGASGRDLKIQVEAYARIGSLLKELETIVKDLPAGSTVQVPIDVSAALNMHPEQEHHATNLHAEISLVTEDGRPGVRQHLPPRFIFRSTNRQSAMFLNPSTVETPSQRGVLTPERQRLMEQLPLAAEDDSADDGIGSGVYQFEPAAKTGEAALQVALPPLAAIYSVKFCFKYGTDFIDRTTGDYWIWAGNRTARGIRARIYDQDNDVVWYDYTDPDTGCTPNLQLYSAYKYKIRLYSQAKVYNDNRVYVLTDETDRIRYGYWAAYNFTPSSSGTYTFTWLNSRPGYTENVANMAAAGGWSIHRRYGGTSNQIYYLFHQECPGASGSCKGMRAINGRDSYPVVFIGDGLQGRKRKFIISHELGHALGSMRDEYSKVSSTGYGLDAGVNTTASTCATGDGHKFSSEEWQSAAANEGFAHLYAATVWNNYSQNDCDFHYYKSDDFHPRDGVTDTSRVYSCESGHKFLDNECYGGGSHTLHSGNEADWLRFWWDLHTDGSVLFGDISRIWDRANPRSWSDGNVYSRLRSAGVATGISGSYWDFLATYNGVKH